MKELVTSKGVKVTEVPPRLNIMQVAKMLRVSRSTIYRWSRDGLSDFPEPCEHIGKVLMWDKEVIHNWILSKRVK